MLTLDENIIIESFNLFYNRIPDLKDDGNRQLIQDLMYFLRYFHISLYGHSLEGMYPKYELTDDNNLYSELIDDIVENASLKKYKYPLSNAITNKKDAIDARDIAYNFLKNHSNLRLNDLVVVDYLIKNNKDVLKYKKDISEKDIEDIKRLFTDIRDNDYRIPKVKKKSLV